MLWSIIYEFFIKYVFGGVLSEDSVYAGLIGYSFVDNRTYYTTNFDISINGYVMSLGNYLSLIATIISMVVIVVLCCLLIKKIYNICAHVIG